jgi:hypothetical protein
VTDEHAPPLLNPELWHLAAPILPTHDVTLTAGFLAALGFALPSFEADRSLVARCGGVELHYDLARDLDPFAAPGAVFVAVTNAELLHAELFEADVMPDLTGPDGGDPAELRARWDSERDLSRLGPLRETSSATVGFSLFDPSNNQLRCSQPR